MISNRAQQAILYIKKKIKQENDKNYKERWNGVIVDDYNSDCIWLIKYLVNDLKIISKSKVQSKMIGWFTRVLLQKEQGLYYLVFYGYPVPLKILRSLTGVCLP